MTDIPFVVCAAKGSAGVMDGFPDNQEGECSMCGEEVVHRPHIPTPSTLICTECFLEIYKPEEMALMVTDSTVQELMGLQKKETQ